MGKFGDEFESAMSMMGMCNYRDSDRCSFDMETDFKLPSEIDGLETTKIIDKYLGEGSTIMLLKKEIEALAQMGRINIARIAMNSIAVTIRYQSLIMDIVSGDGRVNTAINQQFDISNDNMTALRLELSNFLFRNGRDYTYNNPVSILDSIIVNRNYMVDKFSRTLEEYELTSVTDSNFYNHGFAHFLSYGKTVSYDPNVICRKVRFIEGFDFTKFPENNDIYEQLCAVAGNLKFSTLVGIWRVYAPEEEFKKAIYDALTGSFTLCGLRFDDEACRYLLLKKSLHAGRLSDVVNIDRDEAERICGNLFNSFNGKVPYITVPTAVTCILRDDKIREAAMSEIENIIDTTADFRKAYERGLYRIVQVGREEFRLVRTCYYLEMSDDFKGFGPMYNFTTKIEESIKKIGGSDEPILKTDKKFYEMLLKFTFDKRFSYFIQGFYFYVRRLEIRKGASTQDELIKVAENFMDSLSQITSGIVSERSLSEGLSKMFAELTGETLTI